jgi:7-cyano-7-deazaguanine synthase
MDEEVDIIAIVSGGLDSATMLWHLQSREYNVVEVLSFDYNQRHKIELEYVKKLVEKFNTDFNLQVPHHVVDVSSIGKLLNKGALTGGEEVPNKQYDVESQKITIVPNRNGIFLNIAAGRAVTLGVPFIAYAAHSSDSTIYPDCRPEYIEAMDAAIELGNAWQPVNIVAPFMNLTKTDVVKSAIKLKVPIELTWSCYDDGDRPCLKCGTCIERTGAFLNADSKDIALSPEEWEKAIGFYRLKTAN